MLLIARLQPNGKITALHQTIASPRLGEGLTGKGKLKLKAIARTLRALKKLKRETGRFKPDFYLALGTNIYRRAKDGQTAARYFEKELGIPFLILSAAEEARLEFLGATSGLKTPSKVVVVDVGGGSSEIIWGRGKNIKKKVSFEVGAVRLKEAFPALKGYTGDALQSLQAETAKKVSKLKQTKDYPLAVLTGGTATTLAAFSFGLKKYKGEKVHGLKTTPKRLKKLVDKFSRLSLFERRRALSFDPARADIIVPGGIILLEILNRLGVRKVIISDHGLRWGAAYAYFS